MKKEKYILLGASQSGTQWDGSGYTIRPGEIITMAKKTLFRDLYRIESDGRIVDIDINIIKRHFIKLD